MSKRFEPNPPARKDEDFPKTNTIPSGWVMDELTAAYNPGVTPSGSNGNQPASRSNGKVKHDSEAGSSDHEELFSRRLDPHPAPGDEHGMWL